MESAMSGEAAIMSTTDEMIQDGEEKARQIFEQALERARRTALEDKEYGAAMYAAILSKLADAACQQVAIAGQRYERFIDEHDHERMKRELSEMMHRVYARVREREDREMEELLASLSIAPRRSKADSRGSPRVWCPSTGMA
ncbi:MAG: hypothetical protein NUW01_07230 [Gemmatimonadaceae bacterium]|nr:hypothetical protein [Gemmatimonadaceae bacterium]